MYLDDQFGTEVLKKYLESDDVVFYYIIYMDEPIGFIKLNFNNRLKDYEDKSSCELEKMYVLKSHLRKGAGKAAMMEILSLLKQRKIELFFLCVIETNLRAIRFYEALGFKFHGKLKLDIPLFKDELRGMDRMVMEM